MYCYIINICMLFLLTSLQAMDYDLVQEEEGGYFEGQLYLEGPIAYGPAKYYEYLSKTMCDKNIQTYEPLIQVAVLIDDKDNNGNYIKSPWTSNVSLFAERKPLPYRIQQYEETSYKKQYQSNDIPDQVKDKIKNKYFPSYIPLMLFADAKMFENFDRARFHMSLSAYKHLIFLQCINNPTVQASFKDHLASKIKDFIKAPQYFKWSQEKSASMLYYTPLRALQKNNIVEAKHLPETVPGLLRMCAHDFESCPQYCNDDPNSYQHGEKGKEIVAQIQAQFNCLSIQ